MNKETRADRIYRRMLRLFPFDFQREYGAEMHTVFRDERRDTDGLRLWSRTIAGFLRTAAAEHLDVFRRDVRDGLRSLARNKVVTLVAITSLAVGVGANIGIFSVVNAMWLKALPLPDAERLIRVTNGSAVGAVAYEHYVQYRDGNRTLLRLAAFQDTRVTWRADGPAETVVATAVSGNYFAALSPPLLMGRAISDADDRLGAPAVVMVSETFWRDRLGANPAAVGRTLMIDRHPSTLIGVTPAWFGGTDRDGPRDVWISWNALGARRPENSNMVGRLRPGISMARAQADLAVIATQLQREPQEGRAAIAIYPARMVPPALTAQVVPMFAFFIVLVGLSMLIPCLNIGSLLLARAAERRREMGIRVALGAGRTQLMRQLLTESLLIAVSGGVAGAAVFGVTVAILVASFDLSRDFSSRMVFDWHVPAFTIGHLPGSNGDVRAGSGAPLREDRCPGCAEGRRRHGAGSAIATAGGIHCGASIRLRAAPRARGTCRRNSRQPSDHRSRIQWRWRVHRRDRSWPRIHARARDRLPRSCARTPGGTPWSGIREPLWRRWSPFSGHGQA
jgi:hypothetical protein